MMRCALYAAAEVDVIGWCWRGGAYAGWGALPSTALLQEGEVIFGLRA